MGGTGASTGLLPSFTLGCGTWGGSSVSENVSPLHLVNIKKVAYGIKNCATLAADDPTFNHPELTGNCCGAAATPVTPVAQPVSGVSTSTPGCTGTSGYLSPAEYQNGNSGISYSTGCNSCSTNNTAPVASDQPIDTAQLTDMINALVKAMKGE
jgi:acetaldehyde dehydrogenase (acetylating)